MSKKYTIQSSPFVVPTTDGKLIEHYKVSKKKKWSQTYKSDKLLGECKGDPLSLSNVFNDYLINITPLTIIYSFILLQMRKSLNI